MLLALDRIHDLVTLNEPHQAFITNMMRERNFWQVRMNPPNSSPQVHHNGYDYASAVMPNVTYLLLCGYRGESLFTLQT
jgi:hypothetical protein